MKQALGAKALPHTQPLEAQPPPSRSPSEGSHSSQHQWTVSVTGHPIQNPVLGKRDPGCVMRSPQEGVDMVMCHVEVTCPSVAQHPSGCHSSSRVALHLAAQDFSVAVPQNGWCLGRQSTGPGDPWSLIRLHLSCPGSLVSVCETRPSAWPFIHSHRNPCLCAGFLG